MDHVHTALNASPMSAQECTGSGEGIKGHLEREESIRCCGADMGVGRLKRSS